MPHAVKTILPLSFMGIDISITTSVLWTFIASLILLLFLWIASRKVTLVPRRYSQNIFEFAIEFVEKQIVQPVELDPKIWTPFILGLFLFILFNDWIGLIPGATTGTGNINETGALAVFVFMIATFFRFKIQGIKGFMRSLVPEGVSGPILIILFPIEVISQLIKPFSLAIRLFANMSGGHLLMLTIIGFTVLFSNFLVSVLSLAGTIAIAFFEIFVGFIQAYVFAFLAALMIGESLAEEH
jgi:F-type H+-transporting ATPase subunit a